MPPSLRTITPASFLSTLPARGATRAPVKIPHRPQISIHAPREGSDTGNPFQSMPLPYFYPRSPRGERQAAEMSTCDGLNFYPRSPRGERLYLLSSPDTGTDFYPRSPRGERHLLDL